MHYQYNIHKQRSFTQYSDNETGEYKSKYYIGGNYELEDNNGEERGLNYIYSPDGLVCIVETDEQNEISATNWLFDKKASKIRLSKFYETKEFTLVNDCFKNENNATFDGLLQINYNDHLGSIYAITDENGQIKDDNGNPQIFSYDAWGNRRDYTNWTKSYTAETTLFDRGYTGHQMLDEFGIIEMNGRIYDPVIGRFFSPDPYVQSPDNSQNFNRYSYVLNNPLKYTDPSGELYLWDDAIVAGVGFGVGYVSHGLKSGDWGWNAVGAGAIGAGTALLGYYSGGIACHNLATMALGYSGRYAASAAISSIMPSATVPIGNNFSINFSMGVGFGSGGIVAGGNISGTYSGKKGDVTLGYGGGTNHSAWSIGYSGVDFGISYYKTKYGNAIGPDGMSNNQTVGGVSFYAGQFSARLENDFLAFKGEDRWRSNAVELGFFGGDLVIGTTLYNNHRKEGDPVIMEGYSHAKGEYGRWVNGQTYSSPLYVGFRSGNNISRLGYSAPMFQHIAQNKGAHEKGFLRVMPFGHANYFMDYDHFQSGTYSYSGYYNQYSLWGK